MRHRTKIIFIVLTIFSLIYITSKQNQYIRSLLTVVNNNTVIDCGVYGCLDEYLDFEGFDNEKGSEKPVVPNIIHLLRFRETQFKFYQVIGLFSIYFNHKPDLIYIHCDNCSFHGKYWEWVKAEPDLMKIIKIHQIKLHDTIFGKKFGWLEHKSDVWRLLVLMNYGGIYFDNDVHVINSFNKYRHFEMTICWTDKNDGIGSQVLIAHKNARFLKTYFDSYRYNYTSNIWYWNAGFFPAKILQNYTYLIHVGKEELGTQNLVYELYQSYLPDWKKYDSIHLLINHRYYMDKNSPIKEFDEFNILNYNYTYGYMVRDILHKMKRI